MRLPALLTTVAIATTIGGCSPSVDRCTGSFDGEVVPTAEGYASSLGAVEAWAAGSPAPDAGWVETASGARVGDWVVETVQTSDGGWFVESLSCSPD